MIKVKKFSVRSGDTTYLPGEVIHDLEPTEEQSLVDGGYCEYDTSIEVKAEQKLPLATDDGPLTIEQFTGLKAEEQKELLENEGIEAGSNAPTRIQQYTDWQAGQVGQQAADDPDAGGPKTGL